VIPILVAVGALALAVLAEWLHARRVARVALLAFGPSGHPAAWAMAAPYLRCLAVTAAAWGTTTLMLYDPVQEYDKPVKKASKQLIICMDVSPSMMLKDAGPNPEKMTRAAWAGKLVQGVLDRLDAETTRVTLVAFYTDALPIVRETFDKEVVSNALDGLPMYVAFEPGGTDMHKGVTKTLDLAQTWARKSAMLLVVSDGDASANSGPIRRPDSIADAIVIGVGDPMRSSIINGHGSRQDTDALKQLAARLGGLYHNGNTKHLPSEVLDQLSVTSPNTSLGIGLREAGLVSAGFGAAVLGLIEPLLILFGRPSLYRRSRAVVSRRAAKKQVAAQAPSLAGQEARA
jgi:Ca-activated chloride channel family protein